MVPTISVSVFLIVIPVFSGKCTVVNPPQSLGESFRQCLISESSGNLGHCMGESVMSKLVSLDANPEFDLIDGITLTRGSQEYREINIPVGDTPSLRSILDNLNYMFSKRNVRWDMSYVYPGLEMRVVPSTAPGGTLEFILDSQREAFNVHSLKESSTGRLLARQFLVPFLLGFKFNVASIIPILFGILALLAKKAVIISKLALIVTSAFGLGSLLLGNFNRVPQQHQGHPFNPGFGYHGYKYPDDEYQEDYYRGVPIPAQSIDQLRLYGNIENIAEPYDRTERDEITKGRNFAWSEDEKTKNEVRLENK